MDVAKIIANRSAIDTDKIVSLGMKSIQKLQGSLRHWILRELRTGNRFNVEQYMVQNITPLLVNIQLAAHLSGYRRFRLTLQQNPSLKKRYEKELLNNPAQRSLELASETFNQTIKVLKARTGLDLDALSAQYETNALKVLHTAGADMENELRGTLEMLTARGAHVKDAKEELAAQFKSLGITPQNNYTFENIFRTQSQLAFGAGKWQAEQDPTVQEILWGYKYVTVGDDRVREEHAILEGVTLPKNDPFWLRFYPPNGWSCRCQAIPIFEQVKIVSPRLTMPDGITPISPDKGFNFNPGIVFANAG